MSGHKLHMPENMDSFEKGWTLRDNAAGAKARLAGAAENKSKVGNLDPAESRPGGFLPSIGGSATVRMSASKVRRRAQAHAFSSAALRPLRQHADTRRCCCSAHRPHAASAEW